MSSVNDFTLTVRTGGKKTEVMNFSAPFRSALLCDLQRYFAGTTGSRRFVAVKVTRQSVRQECSFELGTWYASVYGTDGRTRLSHYLFSEVTAVKVRRRWCRETRA